VVGRGIEQIENNGAMLIAALRDIASGLRSMAELMPRMADGCEPKVFHELIRTPLSSFGRPVRFEGVGGGSGETRELGGASGAQSAVLPAVDAFLGIGHSGPHELVQWSPKTTPFLRHLPPAHRELIRKLRSSAPGSASTVQTISTRLALEGATTATEVATGLITAHAECLNALTSFRKAHMALVRQFIVSPALSERAEAFKTRPTRSTNPYPVGETVVAVNDGALKRSQQLPLRGITPSPVRPPSGGTNHGGVGSDGSTSPVDVRDTFVGTGGSDLMSFLSGRLLDTAKASVRHR